MRQKEFGEAEQRLLGELAGRISNRLETALGDRHGTDVAHVSIELHERGRRVVMELPAALLVRARAEPVAREAIRVRLKTARDRMLFRPPPRPLPKHIASAADPAFLGRGGFGRQFSRGRR